MGRVMYAQSLLGFLKFLFSGVQTLRDSFYIRSGGELDGELAQTDRVREWRGPLDVSNGPRVINRGSCH